MKTDLKFVVALTTLLILTAMHGRAQEIPLKSDYWTINAEESKFELFNGQQSLFIKNGRAILNDSLLLNGWVEFDLFLKEERSFSGLMFRLEDGGNYEEIYFRSHQNNKPDAVQYTPVYNGSAAWQLYHDQGALARGNALNYVLLDSNGYNGIVNYRYDQWMHAKVHFQGNQARLFVDDKLILKIPYLMRDLRSGGIGLKSDFGGVYFANFKMGRLPNTVASAQNSPAPNLIQHWQVSSLLGEKMLQEDILSDDLLNNLTWQNLHVDNRGILNIAKLHRATDSLNTTLVMLEIPSAEETIKEFIFGYSDRVNLYLNNQKIYAGSNNYQSRDYRYLGTIGLFDAVFLPLKRGQNKLIIGVSESFGGWGLMGRFGE